MQPSTEILSNDIKTLADWIFQQFAPTSPVKVKNILDTPFDFRYCVGEDVVTPDAVSRNVLNRTFQVFHFEPGEEQILMGAAAYLFVDKIARQYVFIKEGGESDDPIKKTVAAGYMANVAVLVEAAKLAISSDAVTYTSNPTPTAQASEPLRDASQLSDAPNETTTATTLASGSDDGADALDALNNDKSIDERFRVVPPDPASGRPNAQFYVDDEEVSSDEFNKARNEAVHASTK